MTDPFQSLRWALGPDDAAFLHLVTYRTQVREVIGINEEAALAKLVKKAVEGFAPVHAAELAVEHYRAALIGNLAKQIVEKEREVWANYLGTPTPTESSERKLVDSLAFDLRGNLMRFLSERGLPDHGSWSVMVYRTGERVPPHVRLVGEKLVVHDGYTVGDEGEKLVALAKLDEDGGTVVHCTLMTAPAIALGYGWEDAPTEPEAPLSPSIVVVDEAALQAGVDGAREDIDDALDSLG